MPSELALPDSKHFTVQPLAEGIFAVIAKDGGSAICNAVSGSSKRPIWAMRSIIIPIAISFRVTDVKPTLIFPF